MKTEIEAAAEAKAMGDTAKSDDLMLKILKVLEQIRDK
jgi:hypothetical protein